MIYTLRKEIIKLVRKRLERQSRQTICSNEGLWAVLGPYIERTQSTGCQFVDYEALYNHVRRTKPREILECGTGTSTVVLAYALKENEREGANAGRVTSMEEGQDWFDQATRLLPEELRQYVEICLSPTVEAGYTIYRGLRYRDVPDRPYDFVFTDGPGTLAPSDGTRACDFDYLHLVRHSSKPVSAIIDSRLTTCYITQKVFGSGKFRFDVFRNLGFVGPCTQDDMRRIARSSSLALAHSKRIFGSTRFRLKMEPPLKAQL
jgi:hypothetical protein